jgi:tyrosyl-tRNA synthetase
LEGTDGVKKMSKSYNNYIALNDTPKDMFGKIMSISDELMYRYYELLTQNDINVVKTMHPKKAKIALANQIVEKYYGKESALKENEKFNKIFAGKNIPDDVEEYMLDSTNLKLSELLVKSGMLSSKNEAKRLIEQGGIKIDSQKIESDLSVDFSKPFILQVGKRKFKRIV